MSFADLGISKPVVGALAKRDITSLSPSSRWSSATRSPAMTCSSSRPPARARRSPSACRWSISSEPGSRRAPPWSWRRPASSPARSSTSSHSVARARGPADRRRLRRRRLRPPERRRAQGRHRRRHPRPARGPDRARRHLARPGPGPRPRRGRPDARHGLPAGRQAGSSPRPRTTARRCSSRRPSRAPPASSPPPTPASPAATPRRRPSASSRRHRAPLRPRRVAGRQARPPGRAPAATRPPSRTLVFVRTKRGADRLVKRLRSREVAAVAMHGDKSQGQRERALARFENGDVATLIATDVAARGIDVDDITHVINFDVPGDRDAYVHRIGRTGRAGRTRRRHQLRARRPGRRDAARSPATSASRPSSTARRTARRTSLSARPMAAAGPPAIASPVATASPMEIANPMEIASPPRAASPTAAPRRPEKNAVGAGRGTRCRMSPTATPTAPTAAKWTCDGCGMIVSRMDGERDRLPRDLGQAEQGLICLLCRRDLAAEEAIAAAPSDSPIGDPRRTPPRRPDRVRGAPQPGPPRRRDRQDLPLLGTGRRQGARAPRPRRAAARQAAVGLMLAGTGADRR